jgi:L-fucose mutarotase
MPLDHFVTQPVVLMAVAREEDDEPAIWDRYRKIIRDAEGETELELMERFVFYERAKRAYAIVATGETALYANHPQKGRRD